MKLHFSLPLGRVAFAACVVGGLALALAFPKAHVWPLALFALVPPAMVSQNRSLKGAFGCGFLFGFTYNLALLYWVIEVLVTYGHLDIFLASGIFILFLCYLALYPGLFLLGLRLAEYLPGMAPGGMLWVLAGAALFSGLEFFKGFFLTGFPWEPLGAALIPCSSLVQLADVVGIDGLSFLVALVNLCLAAAVMRARGTGPGRAVVPAVVFVLVLATLWGYGYFRLKQVNRLMAEGTEKTWAVAQGNVNQTLKWDPDYRVATLVAYRDLTNAAAKKDPWMIVWPETAAPFFYLRDVSMQEWMEQMVGHVQKPLIFGAPAYLEDDRGAHYYNRAYLLGPDGKMIHYYDKVHLVPFGEYVPLKKYLPFIGKISQASGNYESGEKARLLEWDGNRIGVLICYESIFPGLARAHVKAGADWLVIMTNDAWFGRSSACSQHFSQAIGRAIETRRAVIRAANTGISGFIQPNGEFKASLEIFTKGVAISRVSRPSIDTIYTAVGDVIPWTCLGVTLFLFPAALIRRKKHAGRSETTI